MDPSSSFAHALSRLIISLRRCVVPALVYVGLIVITVAWAPNYRWSDEAMDFPFGSDFLQEWVGARMILTGHGDDLYDAEVFRAWQHDRMVVGFEWNPDRFYPPVYPPWHYALFVPFALFPYRWAAMFWVALLWGLVFINGFLIRSIIHHARMEWHEVRSIRLKQTSLWWLPILLFPAVPMAVMFGQKSLLWLAVFSLVVRSLQRVRNASAGAQFALMMFKPTLFYLLPVCMVRYRNLRFLLGCCAGLAVVCGLSLAMLPWGIWQGYLGAMLHSVDYGTQGGYRVDWSCNVWSIALGAPVEWQAWIRLGVCVPLACVVLATLFKASMNGVQPEAVFQWMAATLLLAPHAYHYDLCILLLPICWMAIYAPRLSAVTFMILAFAVALSTKIYPWLPLPLLPLALIGCSWIWRLPKGCVSEALEGVKASYGIASVGDVRFG
jgi:hypothetical protein